MPRGNTVGSGGRAVYSATAEKPVRTAAQTVRVLGRLAIPGIPELMEVVTLAQQGKIRVLLEHFPLQRADEAYQLLADGGPGDRTPDSRGPQSAHRSARR